MTVDGDSEFWVDDPSQTSKPAVRASMGPGNPSWKDTSPWSDDVGDDTHRYDPKRGCWVLKEPSNDNSQESLTRDKYTEWWEDALADAIKDLWRTPGAM